MPGTLRLFLWYSLLTHTGQEKLPWKWLNNNLFQKFQLPLLIFPKSENKLYTKGRLWGRKLITREFALEQSNQRGSQAFFNSSKKLKEKTQPLRANMLNFEKNSSFGQISWGTPINMPLLLPNIFNKGKIFKHFWLFFKNQEKNFFWG